MSKKETPGTQRKQDPVQVNAATIPASSIKPWHYIAALALLCLVFYYKVIFGAAYLWEDLVHQEFPHRIFARDCLMNLQFPHWNPYTFSGMPFFAAIHTGVLYPFNLLMSLLSVDNETFWYLLQLMIISHVFFAGLSMFLFLRYKKFSDQAAFFGAISYMLCGFFVTHIIHSLMLYILAWLPIVILLLEKGLRENKLHLLVITGSILGITIFAGHPQITFYQFLFLGSYCLYVWLSIPGRNIGALLSSAIPFVLAAGIAMIQLLPTAEIGNNSARVGWSFEQACEGSFSFAQIVSFLMPKVFGAWSSPESQAPQFWLKGPFMGYFTYWDTCFYTGVVILLFAAIQCRNLKKDLFVRFAVIWAVASLCVALGRNFFVYNIMFNYVPGFGRFRSPARILFTWNFLAPLLAAYTFDSLSKESLEKIKKPLFIALGVCAALGIAVSLGFFKNFWPIELEDKKIADYTAVQGLVLVLNSALLCIPLLLVLKNRLSANGAKAIILCALIIDLFLFGFGHHVSKTANAAKYHQQNSDISNALKKEAASDIFRVNTRQFNLNPDSMIVSQTGLMVIKRNQGMLDKIFMTEGYNPLSLFRRIPPLRGRLFDEFLDLLNIKYFINPGYGSQSKDLILLNSDKLPRAKMFYAAQIFNSDSLVKDFMLNNTFDYRNILLLTEKPSLPLPPEYLYINNDVEIINYTVNKIDLSVTTAENGLLWLSEIWYPAWKATVDNKPAKILCADYSFRAIEVPKGSDTVKLVYSSKAFYIGGVVTLISLLGALGFLGVFYWKKRKSV